MRQMGDPMDPTDGSPGPASLDSTPGPSGPVLPGNRSGSGKRRLARLLLGLGLVYLGWCGGMYAYQDKLIFPRHLAPRPTPYGLAGRDRELAIATESGARVIGWFLPARSADARHPRPAVIFFHGNGEIIDYQQRVPSLWRRLNVSVLLPEYRGYGRSSGAGDPSEEALVADGLKFYDELLRQPEVDPARIIVQGHSLGGGVAAQVAARRLPGALILESTFTSIADFAWGYGVPPFLARNPFHTDEAVSTLRSAIFIGHGRADAIVPVSHGRRLHAIAPGSTYLELDCGHMDMPGEQPDDPYREAIRRFLADHRVLADP
jgi:fermentation-respiration switch protein FrsA (DUF1100 family)